MTLETPLQKMKKRRYWLFLGLVFPYLISYFQRSAPAVVGTEILAELELSPTSLGVLVSMYAWGYAAAQLPAGIFSDTLGARKTISFCVLIAAVGSVLFAVSGNFSVMSCGRFLVGVGVGFVYVPAVRVMTDWYRQDELATYSGVLLGSGNVGALVSAGPMVLAMDIIGWRSLFLVVAGVTVMTSVICWLSVRDTPAELGLPCPDPRSREADAPAPGVVEAFSAVFSNRQFYFVALFMFCYYGTVLSVGSLWAGPYLLDVYGLTKQQAGNIVMMIPLGMVFGCPLSGYLSDKIFQSRKKVLVWGAVLHCSSYIPLVFMAGDLSPLLLYPLYFLYGLTGGAFVIGYACGKETTGPRFAGTALGSTNIFLFLGGAFFQTAMGYILDCYSSIFSGTDTTDAYRASFAFAAMGLLAALAVFLFFKERPFGWTGKES